MQNLKMADFVFGGCEAARDVRSFLDLWEKSRKNPCCACLSAKTGCSFFLEQKEQTSVQPGETTRELAAGELYRANGDARCGECEPES